MAEPLLMIVGGTSLKPKPPIPVQSQVIPCPAGMNGTWTQNRVCTWNVAQQAWECTPWNTVVYDCKPNEIVFDSDTVYNDPHYVPPLGGGCYSAGDGNYDYGQEINMIVPSGGYTMTLKHRVRCVWEGSGSPNNGFWSYLDISIPGAGGGRVKVVWDRKYSRFDDMTLDSTGKASWKVPCREFTANGTRFVVTLTPV